MNAKLKASLVEHMQAWLDKEEVHDSLGGTEGIWQDTTTAQRTAHALAAGAETVIDGMALQSQLEERMGA